MNNRDYHINPSTPSDKDIEKHKDFDTVVDKVQAAAHNPVLNVVKSKWFIGISAGIVLASVAALYWQQRQPVNNPEVTATENVAVPAGEEVAVVEADPVGDHKKRIDPPIPQWDVPYEVFDIDADKGADLLSKNGSAIHIDKQSFTDEKGNTVHGKVSIRYREFHDPLGIFLSGIPMEYDTAGKACTFESAGMLELVAEKEGQDIQLRSGKEIQVDLVSLNKDDFNLYYFDTVAGRWEYTGESETKAFTDLTQMSGEKVVPVSEPVRPVFREQAKKKYTFSAQVDFKQFPELNKDVIFEIDDSLNVFDPLLYEVRWESISLKRSKYAGHYSLLLKKGSREVILESFPVLSTANYAKEIENYKNSKAEFEKHKFEKKEFSYSYIEPEASAVQNEIAHMLRLGADQKQLFKEKISFRSILIARTGLHNCDTPIIFTEVYPVAANVQPQFSTKQKDQLKPEKIYNVAGRKNALFTNDAGATVYYSKKDKNTMWILLPDETIAIARPEDFKAIKGSTHDFEMDVYSSIEGLKKIKAVLD